MKSKRVSQTERATKAQRDKKQADLLGLNEKGKNDKQYFNLGGSVKF